MFRKSCELIQILSYSCGALIVYKNPFPLRSPYFPRGSKQLWEGLVSSFSQIQTVHHLQYTDHVEDTKVY